MTESEKRMHRCAFTGHRPEKLTESKEDICERLQAAIEQAYTDGFNVFITGMARGVDLWAAAIVLELRQQHNDVKLICAVPFEGFEDRWSEDNRREYSRILEDSDLVRHICPRYSK